MAYTAASLASMDHKGLSDAAAEMTTRSLATDLDKLPKYAM